MIVEYTPKFAEQLAAATEYGIARFGHVTAERTYRRLIWHIETFLVARRAKIASWLRPGSILARHKGH